MLNQRKAWSEKEDKLLFEIYTQKKTQIQMHTINWNNIAEQFNSLQQGQKRTGKQCRQRWFNQLDPEIKKSSQWNQQEKSTVLQLHNSYGNKWSVIAKFLDGRTDNSVKNFINSTLRKGLRLLNLYLSKNKKFPDFQFKNLKQYKTDLLTKILLFSGDVENFHQQEYSIMVDNRQSNEKQTLKLVYQIAQKIKSELMFLQDIYLRQNINLTGRKKFEPVEVFQSIIKKIQKLNSLCKKKKQKKFSGKLLIENCIVSEGYSKNTVEIFVQQSQISITESRHQKITKCGSSLISHIDTEIISIPKQVRRQNVKKPNQPKKLQGNSKIIVSEPLICGNLKLTKFRQQEFTKNNYIKQSDIIFNKQTQFSNKILCQNIDYDFCQITANTAIQKSSPIHDLTSSEEQIQNSNSNFPSSFNKDIFRDLGASNFFIAQEPKMLIQTPPSPHQIPLGIPNYLNSQDDYFLFSEMMDENPPLYPMEVDISGKRNKFGSEYADFNYVTSFYQLSDEEDFI